MKVCHVCWMKLEATPSHCCTAVAPAAQSRAVVVQSFCFWVFSRSFEFGLSAPEDGIFTSVVSELDFITITCLFLAPCGSSLPDIDLRWRSLLPTARHQPDSRCAVSQYAKAEAAKADSEIRSNNVASARKGNATSAVAGASSAFWRNYWNEQQMLSYCRISAHLPDVLQLFN